MRINDHRRDGRQSQTGVKASFIFTMQMPVIKFIILMFTVRTAQVLRASAEGQTARDFSFPAVICKLGDLG